MKPESKAKEAGMSKSKKPKTLESLSLTDAEVSLACAAINRWQTEGGPAATPEQLPFFTPKALCAALDAAMPNLTPLGQSLAKGIIEKVKR